MKMYTFKEGNSVQTVIAKSELKDGAYYRGECRNAISSLARWDGKRQCFWYMRSKWGEIFLEAIPHPEDEKTYDVFRVKEKVTSPEFVIPFD